MIPKAEKAVQLIEKYYKGTIEKYGQSGYLLSLSIHFVLTKQRLSRKARMPQAILFLRSVFRR
jgi:hypothetical protein